MGIHWKCKQRLNRLVTAMKQVSFVLVFVLFYSASSKPPKSKSDCCFQPKKVEYIGSLNTAKTGEACLPWPQSKNKKIKNNLKRNAHSCENKNSLESNFCRSLDGKVPKCLVKGGKLKPCAVPLCVATRKNQLGLNYKGRMNKGRFLVNANDPTSKVEQFTCMRWDGKKKNPDIEIKATPKGKKNHNFCRNPDNDRNGPWCYKQNFVPSFDSKGKPLASNYAYCDIPICGKIIPLKKGC